MTIEPGIERRKIEGDTIYFTDNIGNPDYDTCVLLDRLSSINTLISHGIIDSLKVENSM